MNEYIPSKKILQKYADVLVNFALNGGSGIKKGEVVQITVPDVAKPLAKELYIAALKAGAHPMLRLVPTGFDRDFYSYASQDQLTHFPEKFLRAKADLLDHVISVIADPDPNELKGIDSKKIMLSREAQYPYREWLFDKEHKKQFSWTLGLWGTQAKADIVGLSLKKYWDQIISACFLDKPDPVAEWKKLTKMQRDIKDKLNALEIDTVRVVGPDVDLTIKLGANRAWKTGSGCNIPSFEHFTSPDWRGTHGWISFNQPLYRYGNVIEGVKLEFKDGIVTKATAKKGKKVLLDMLATKNANKLGEFSLTDTRFSRITHPMAETLFDENIGGPFGNTHVAVGMAYKDCYKGDAATVSENEWEQMGYNNSSVHTDIVSTTDRTVTATLVSGEKLVIYQNGQFTL
ncbi:MAG: aminopeptidase [Patescibacteria group bacterium]|nr:MAG: aminopeptidase [Patescibacteria group bacterium]